MKTILIKGPTVDNDIFSSFPLIHYVKDEYLESKIIIILNEGQNNFYNLLPFQVEVYFIPLEKYNLRGIHHYAVNLLEAFNIDYFIDLENTLKSAFLGFAFKAKTRIGYKSGMNSIFLNFKLDSKEIPLAYDSDEKYLNLFSKYKKIQELDYKVRPHIEKNIKDKSERDILVVLKNANDFKNELVKMLLEFEEKVFQIFSIHKSQNLAETELVKTIREQDSTNCYKVIEFDTYKKLQEKIYDSAFVLTDIEWVSYCTAYLGRESFLLSRDNRPMPKYKYFDSSPVRISFENDSIVMNMERENQKISDIKGLVDFIYKFLDI